MPLRRTAGGWKFGTRGKLYKGKNARTKALKQARAIEASKHRRKK